MKVSLAVFVWTWSSHYRTKIWFLWVIFQNSHLRNSNERNVLTNPNGRNECIILTIWEPFSSKRRPWKMKAINICICERKLLKTKYFSSLNSERSFRSYFFSEYHIFLLRQRHKLDKSFSIKKWVEEYYMRININYKS